MSDPDPDTTIEIKLLTEQLSRFHDRYESHLERLETLINHNQQLTSERLESIRSDLKLLQKDRDDHETRIRDLRDTSTSFKTMQSLFSGGSIIASLTALIRSFLGG
jgi:chromosome segregation ATPase